MAFAGFSDPAGKFSAQLAKKQSREWFQLHKEQYEDEWAKPMLALLTEVAQGTLSGPDEDVVQTTSA